jgi:SAM-dependent methyltransferase
MVETTLIQKMNQLGVFPQEWKTEEEVKSNEEAVEKISGELFDILSPDEIIEHNIAAYSASTEAYDAKPANQKAVPELPLFMNLMAEGALVLDLGSGHGRDALYNLSCRDSFNREGMISPTHVLRVVPLEGSKEFLDLTYDKLQGNLSQVPFMAQGDFTKPGTAKPYRKSSLQLEATLTQGDLQPVFDGIWSCASFLIHMPEQYLDSSIADWGKTLKEGGVFAVSYIPPRKEGQTTKFLASRSAPGEIKVFSHYTPSMVDNAFTKAGFALIDSSSGDYGGRGHIQRKFFSGAFYKKG